MVQDHRAAVGAVRLVNDHAFSIGVVVNTTENAVKRCENARHAVRLQVHVDWLWRLTEDALGEDGQRRLVGGRLAVETDLHGFTDTPPRTPLYHTSLSGESP